MDRMVYTALSGLKGQMSAQAAIANNIANASTTGFRADRVAFQQMMLKGGRASNRARRRPRKCSTPIGARARSSRPAAISTSPFPARRGWPCRPPTAPKPIPGAAI